ncbi:hypothetical protein HUJ04_005511 [Dendroctonus ponderosae]|nr:hypothetical protein HUJ04_005511 [Dendroctonus ponderosae]
MLMTIVRALVHNIALRLVADARPQLFFPGACGPGKCSGETACRTFDNNTYTCVCTHTSLPPTLSGDCPRRIVTQDQIVQQKIPVQPPKEPDAGLNQTTILTGDQPMAAIGGGIGAVSLLVPVVVGLLGAALFAWMVCCVRKRAQKRRADAASPVNMKHSLLVPERYAPNPQYSSCCGSEVPIIPRDSVRFLDELGEGCFGKVYKGKRL